MQVRQGLRPQDKVWLVVLQSTIVTERKASQQAKATHVSEILFSRTLYNGGEAYTLMCHDEGMKYEVNKVGSCSILRWFTHMKKMTVSK